MPLLFFLILQKESITVLYFGLAFCFNSHILREIGDIEANYGLKASEGRNM
jgi:hypothetical protein